MKNKYVLIVVAVLVVAGLAGYFVLGKGGKSEIMEKVSDEPFSGTLQAAVAMGVPMRCEYTIEGNQYEGYIKGQKYMGKFAAEGKTMSVIVKDNCMWSWEEGVSSGVKTCYELDEADSSIWDSEDSQGLATGLNYNYTCRPAAIGDDRFDPPGNVEFMDLGEMMQGNMDLEDMEKMMEGFKGY